MVEFPCSKDRRVGPVMDTQITEFNGSWELLSGGRQVWYLWGEGDATCVRNFPSKEAAIARVRQCRCDRQKLLQFVIKHDLWGR